MAENFDAVNRPAHYTNKNIEVITYIADTLTPEQTEGFCLGNALKYISRAGKKDNKIQDLEKAVWYLQRAISLAKNNKDGN